MRRGRVRRHAPSWTQNAAVAQLAEQRTFNPKVVGSIPTGGIGITLEIRAAGPEEDRTGLDRTWSAACWMVHEAHGQGLAAGAPRRSAARDAARAFEPEQEQVC